MTLTEAQPKRDRSLTEGHCGAFCCALYGWVDPFLIAEASLASKSANSLFNFSTARGSPKTMENILLTELEDMRISDILHVV